MEKVTISYIIMTLFEFHVYKHCQVSGGLFPQWRWTIIWGAPVTEPGSFTSDSISTSINKLLRHRRSLGDFFDVCVVHELCRKPHGCLLWFIFRTYRRRPFLFWPTNRIWKVPWRRQRSPSLSHSTPSRHTRGTSRRAAHSRAKGALNTHLTHTLLSLKPPVHR